MRGLTVGETPESDSTGEKGEPKVELNESPTTVAEPGEFGGDELTEKNSVEEESAGDELTVEDLTEDESLVEELDEEKRCIPQS